MASADVDITARPFIQDPSAPEPRGPQPGGNANAPPTRDDLDDLFNYDAGIGDPFKDTEGNTDAAKMSERRRDTSGLDADLGLDEEIKIKKPRKPVAKLDEDRLLSQNGIPKLRRISRERLRFRGKGHEFTDVQRLLNTYQLWLDDLFPKAKFADGLAILEKVGHKKRLKVMRQEWINEDKPKPQDSDHSDDDGDFVMNDARPEITSNGAETRQPEDQSRDETDQPRNNTAQETESESHGLDDETLYGRPDPAPAADAGGEATGDRPEKDELDQLLAEDDARPASVNNPRPPEEDEFDRFADDEEAMEGIW